MYILGDIGNTETKLFLVSTKKKNNQKNNFSIKKIKLSKIKQIF